MTKITRLLPLLTALLLPAIPARMSPAADGPLLIRAGKVITLAGDPLQPGAVLIDDGKIKEIAGAIDEPEGCEVVDFGDAVVIPGLVNGYTDMGVGGGDAEFTREVTPDISILGSIDWTSRQFREARAVGTTCVAVMPGTDNVVSGTSVVVKTAGSDARGRIVDDRGGLVLTMASDPERRNRSRSRPDSIYVRQPTNRMGVVWILRSTFNRVKLEANDGDRILGEALAGRRPTYCVSRMEFDIDSALRLSEEYGFRPVLVGGQEAHKVAERLADLKVPVMLAPLTADADRDAEGSEPNWNRAGLLHAAGVEVALTGDDLLRQARFAVRYGLPPDVAMRAITTGPAELLGVADRVGSLTTGKDADMVVLDGDPLRFTTGVRAVVVDGVIYREGEAR